MDVEEYIGYYKNVVPDALCKTIMNCDYNFQPSTYANNKGKLTSSDERVLMDECWVGKDAAYYEDIKEAFERVIKKYSNKFPLFSVQHTTDFRINRYPVGGFMSSHVDNIHHSHGQQYGYPQVSALLYLNDDYEGGEFYVAGKRVIPPQGAAIIFPSNFMFPHEAKTVTKGTRWSIVSWLM